MQCRRKLFLIGLGGGAENEGQRPDEIFKFRVLKCHFLDFGEDLTEFCWSENSVLVCRNLQFSVLVCRNLQFVYSLVVLNGRRRI
jgi:hypothetical protein